MTEKLKELIINTKLTKKENIIAEFMLNNFTEACFMTSTDIANRLSVSDSSVIRFTRTLGYSGFVDFQRTMRENYTKTLHSVSDTITVPSQRLKKSIEQLDKGHITETHLANVLNNVRSAISKNNSESFDKASDLLISAKTKYIVASRANSGVGDVLLLLLKHMLPNVYITAHYALNVIDHLSDVGEEDCLIVLSFPRYSKMDILAVQMARNSGAKIILITDKATAPLAEYATMVFTVNVDSNTFFNSYVAVLFLAETLCACISKKIGCANEEKLNKIDEYISQLGVF